MSLLNQMLNDLDRRRADGAAPALHREIRPLPVTVTSSLLPLSALATGLVILLAVAGWWFFYGPGRALLEGSIPAPVQLGAATLPPLAVSAPAIPDTVPSQVPPEALPLPDPALAPPPTRLVSSLRLSDELTLPVSVPQGEGAVAASVSDGNIDKKALEPNLRDQAERLYRSAVAQLAQGREHDGISTLRAVLRDDPDHLAARQLLIKLNIDRRIFDLAQADLEEGLRRLPRQTPWALLLSRLLVERNDPAGALLVLERHEVHAGPAAEYQGAMAAMLQRLNRHAEAETRFLRATQAEPTHGRWWLGLGLAREAQGKGSEAREAFRTAQAAAGLGPELRAFAEAKGR